MGIFRGDIVNVFTPTVIVVNLSALILAPRIVPTLRSEDQTIVFRVTQVFLYNPIGVPLITSVTLFFL